MIAADFLAWLIRVGAGVCARYHDDSVFEGSRVYFANHTSHLDFLVIWSALPKPQRGKSVPVAAKDYWERGALRRYLSEKVFRALLIDREKVRRGENPIDKMSEVLERGDSLILFPEGTRASEGEMKTFRPGLYHLAKANSDTELVPVCLENLNRILPKGDFLPVPLLSAIAFGRPMRLESDESKDDFLQRAESSIEELRTHD